MSTSRVREKAARIGRHSNGMLMTPEEFDAADDWNEWYKYELIHGVLVVVPPPAEGERDPNEELGHLLRLHKLIHPQGSLLDKTLSEHHVPFTDNRRRADRVLWIGLGRVPDPQIDIPTIIVEFVSKSRRDWVRDYEEKRQEYLRIGVREYWIIDRFRRLMMVFRPPTGEPAEQTIEANGVYRTPLLPGFELPLAQLLSVADDWKKPRRPRPGV